MKCKVWGKVLNKICTALLVVAWTLLLPFLICWTLLYWMRRWWWWWWWVWLWRGVYDAATPSLSFWAFFCCHLHSNFLSVRFWRVSHSHCQWSILCLRDTCLSTTHHHHHHQHQQQQHNPSLSLSLSTSYSNSSSIIMFMTFFLSSSFRRQWWCMHNQIEHSHWRGDYSLQSQPLSENTNLFLSEPPIFLALFHFLTFTFYYH